MYTLLSQAVVDEKEALQKVKEELTAARKEKTRDSQRSPDPEGTKIIQKWQFAVQSAPFYFENKRAFRYRKCSFQHLRVIFLRCDWLVSVTWSVIF